MPPVSEKNRESKQSSRFIRVRDLPIYYETKTDDVNGFNSQANNDQSCSNNNWLYPYVSQIRRSLQQTWNDNKDLRERVSRTIDTGKAHSQATIDYIHDDQTLLPKVGVVTIAGLGGLLLGHRGGPIRKTFYSSVAAIVALSACYPKQSANILDKAYIRVKESSSSVFGGNSSSRIPSVLENKDRVLYVKKKPNQPTTTIEGDYGQGTPADQHLYTTRGTTS